MFGMLIRIFKVNPVVGLNWVRFAAASGGMGVAISLSYKQFRLFIHLEIGFVFSNETLMNMIFWDFDTD